MPIYICICIYRSYIDIYIYLSSTGNIPYITKWPLSLLYKSNHDDPANIYCTPNSKIIVTEINEYYQTNFSAIIQTVNYNPYLRARTPNIDWVIEDKLEPVHTRTYNEFTPVDIIPLSNNIYDEDLLNVKLDSNERKYKPPKIKDDNARTIDNTGTIENVSTDNVRTMNLNNDDSDLIKTMKNSNNSSMLSEYKKKLKLRNLKSELRRNRKNKNKNK
jgi:hypothetical protein